MKTEKKQQEEFFYMYITVGDCDYSMDELLDYATQGFSREDKIDYLKSMIQNIQFYIDTLD